MYAGCVSGAIEMDEYLGIIKRNGFKNITVHKQKEISLPENILSKYLTSDEISSFNNGNIGSTALLSLVIRNNNSHYAIAKTTKIL